MSTVARAQSQTFEDFCFLVGDGQKADLIDGVIHMASPDNTDANELFVWLISLMHDFAELKDLGKIYGSRVAFRLARNEGPEPDIAFLRKNRLHLVRKGHVAGAPDLAMEIVSPESVDRDYKLKRLQYQDAGVAEYWIIDEIKKKVTLLRLTRNGDYREVRPRKGVLASRVATGFWLRAQWLWQTPRPRKMDVLQQILASTT